AMNVGPVVGVALATMLMTAFAGTGTGASPSTPASSSSATPPSAFVSAMGPTLVILAGVAAVGVLLALRLPGRTEVARVAVRPPHRLPRSAP
ncbi:MFS transporter, partial [Streptomyces sp. WAC 06725]